MTTISLYYRNGSSDKVYHASVEAQGGGFVVQYAYGRRGSTLTTGTKTSAPVDREAALRVFDKLVQSKVSKGYTEGESGTPYLHSDKSSEVSGLLPQLLNVVDAGAAADAAVGGRAAARLVSDGDWVMQEKFDGRRLIIRKAGGAVEGINKLGLFVAVSQPVVDAVLALRGDFTLDGEAVGDRFHAFDLLALDGEDLRGRGFLDRYAALAGLLDGACGAVSAAPCWTGGDKAVALADLRAAGAEGVVFKRGGAPYVAGRPASGGDALKLKFVETCSVVVTAANAQRSVAVSLLDDGGWRSVGNVTVPPNRDVPMPGQVIEVRYLYAMPQGALYQPVYLNVRDDVREDECVAGQLKFKASASV